MESITVVKLGGSAITDKARDCTPNIPVIQHAVEQLARYRHPIILLHGGGSFAHPLVTRSKLERGFIEKTQRLALSETELNLDQLARVIGATLLFNKKPFVPLHPMGFVTMRNGRINRCFLDPIRKSLELELTPLLHGDMVFDNERGWGVLSADKLATLLGTQLKVGRVLLGCDVDGIYSRNPKLSGEARPIVEVTRATGPSLIRNLAREPSDDASGGMLGKATEALQSARRGIESIVFNLKRRNALADVLDGRWTPSTRFVPWS
ncbi:hypothetical protein E6H36_07565 [Candidatus Bathyarchaeota archaeon]|nr:MAG: hypothetical protein AUJ07_11355 [Crenarchaeota archaeon 13_1_40CM_3_53_5]TMI24916.1 MAG: hypothetical protein E6H36_07565 [Candidatus Bathyarchaeota archaeon]TMI33158.1 MAG: hypothetical protein E6H29_00855 [Candidatus Bathyarchaeota archaeon]